MMDKANSNCLALVSKFVNRGQDIAVSLSNKQILVYDSLLNEIKERIQIKSIAKILGSVNSKSLSTINFICTMDGTLQIPSNYKNIGQYIYKLY